MRTHGAVLACCMVLLTAGCSGQQGPTSYEWNSESFVAMAQGPAKPPNVQKEGPMPEGGTFTGVYRSQQIGDVQMVQNGDNVVSSYAYNQAACRVKGKLEGTVKGNLLRFTWTETKKECGVLRDVSGRGYFLYTVRVDDTVIRTTLYGEWGQVDNERGGGPWVITKLRNQQPYELMESLGMQVNRPDPNDPDAGTGMKPR